MRAAIIAATGMQQRRRLAPIANSLLADWNSRSGGGGVVQAIRFNSAPDVTNNRHIDGTQANVTQNATGGLMGDGSLKLAIPTGQGSNTGSWRVAANASWVSDFQGFGAAEWYVQFFFKGNTDWLTPSQFGGGRKICNLSEYRVSSPNSSVSHSGNEIVINNQSWRGYPFAYREYGGSTGLEVPYGGSDFKMQPAIDRGAGLDPDRYCLYSDGRGCYLFNENEWMSFLIRVKIPNYGGSTGNELDISAARYGETSYTQLFNSRNFNIGSDPSICPSGPNGIWFPAYDTAPSANAQGLVATSQEYDQLIVSTATIPCPSVWA